MHEDEALEGFFKDLSVLGSEREVDVFGKSVGSAVRAEKISDHEGLIGELIEIDQIADHFLRLVHAPGHQIEVFFSYLCESVVILKSGGEDFEDHFMKVKLREEF